MDEIATVRNENENLKKIRTRLLQWEAKSEPLAALSSQQEEFLEVITNAWQIQSETANEAISNKNVVTEIPAIDSDEFISSNSFRELCSLNHTGIHTTNDFLLWYDRVHAEISENNDITFHQYLKQLELRNADCKEILAQIDVAMEKLNKLSEEYQFVSQKTSSLNTASEQLIEEQKKLHELSEEIQRRLHYFTQVESLQQRLQSPTMSVTSESFRDCLLRIDECLQYLQENPNFKDSASYTVKYKHCLSKAISMIKNYTQTVMTQATEATLHPSQPLLAATSSRDAAFALYYGKYQTSAAKIKRISQLVECRHEKSEEYHQLLTEMQQNYLTERAAIMSPAVGKAINDLKLTHKNDHCSLMRSACAFLVHVCQDEQRLYFQFFALANEQLTVYLEGLCTLLYDTMRPYIIHINHLETLAEICSILRIEMLEENVQQNPEALEAFATTANQLLQDVQERLVFRAHLYLQSDILNYNPSAGDLAYPDKLEMMESIALSLQDPQHLRRFDSKSSLVSSASSAFETESVDTAYRARNMNSPADLHGMWYPTVRRTLDCLSRLYRCVDRPIFQGLSQEALKSCIQSVATAATKISAAKTPIDGELFEIKHLLILREQIAPFRVDFTIKETSLDFSKVKTAAFGLLQKRKQLFSMGSNNALLEFLLEGTPQIKEHLLDSRKEVDRQLKTVCEQFIKDAVNMLVGPIIAFLEKARVLLANESKGSLTNAGGGATANNTQHSLTYALRQSQWASPQQISSIIQETQRLIKSKLATLQRSLQLYLSNRDTEFIIFRPIRNNIIQSFVKLEQLLTTNGYSSDDMIITSCPSAEQVSILISSASILAAENIVNFSAGRKFSTSSNEGGTNNPQPLTPTGIPARKISFERKVGLDATGTTMENVPEVPESSGGSSAASPAPPLEHELPIQTTSSLRSAEKSVIESAEPLAVVDEKKVDDEDSTSATTAGEV